MGKDVEVAEHGHFSAKDYYDPPPAPLIDAVELTKWSFYRALIAEFIATLLFLYITVLMVIGNAFYLHRLESIADQGGVRWINLGGDRRDAEKKRIERIKRKCFE
uniref:Uncharacterized protein n=1 Tax=Nelumbo nucifera TaxID=4432 RepID=A0A822YTU7_NELNU|nr:TPA_asm: hypothetical protein HUJ06_006173 [Nelumbo nucifera]